MNYDVFYLGDKPNVHENEKFAESLDAACNQSTTENFWIINEHNNFYANFFKFEFGKSIQDNIDKQFINVFPNNLVQDSGVWLCPKKNTDIKVIRGDVKKLVSKIPNYDVMLINHHNDEIDEVEQTLHKKLPYSKIIKVKFYKDYFTTFKKIANLLEPKYEPVWICSSICDYKNFDFNQKIDLQFEETHIYTYPSGNQKFGDTFLCIANIMKDQIFKIDKLENYKFINFKNQKVERFTCPIYRHDDDTHLEKVKCTSFNFPYAIFQTKDTLVELSDTPINLWSFDTQNIIVTSKGASSIIFPRIASFHVKEQLYDYPNIYYYEQLNDTNPLDIVFLSNGENCADTHYNHLLEVTKKYNNKVIRVDNVNGRVNAYHAAAISSSTSWYFTVFAKLLVNENFDWSWQPDRLQDRKHYIFYAHNPVNDLNYGHQAMIAYNKKLVLNNNGIGLDFTLDDNHEVVEINSGTAFYNIDEFTTWRTAFREAIKLKHDNSLVSKNRLEQWKTVGKLQYGEFSILGANDACDYYDQVNGDIYKLKLSYDWPWLKELFTKLYNK